MKVAGTITPPLFVYHISDDLSTSSLYLEVPADKLTEYEELKEKWDAMQVYLNRQFSLTVDVVR